MIIIQENSIQETLNHALSNHSISCPYGSITGF